jgi:hypothetical protein
MPPSRDTGQPNAAWGAWEQAPPASVIPFVESLSRPGLHGNRPESKIAILAALKFSSDRRRTGRGADIVRSTVMTRSRHRLCIAAAEASAPRDQVAAAGHCVELRAGSVSPAFRIIDPASGEVRSLINAFAASGSFALAVMAPA